MLPPFWTAAQFLPAAKLVKHQKHCCSCRVQPKVQAHHPMNWTHRCHCQQMMNIMRFRIKIRALEHCPRMTMIRKELLSGVWECPESLRCWTSLLTYSRWHTRCHRASYLLLRAGSDPTSLCYVVLVLLLFACRRCWWFVVLFVFDDLPFVLWNQGVSCWIF